MDIDHCFPWSDWTRGDLWNLLPAHRSVNGKSSGLGLRHLLIATSSMWYNYDHFYVGRLWSK
jgi:hypothetical protein